MLTLTQKWTLFVSMVSKDRGNKSVVGCRIHFSSNLQGSWKSSGFVDEEEFRELPSKSVSTLAECREIVLIAPTYFKRRQPYDGTCVDDAKELKKLRMENAMLKRLVADRELEKTAEENL